MKKFYLLLLFYFVFFIGFISAQHTYSKIYDLDEDSPRNFLTDMKVFNGSIYTYSTSLCDIEDTVDDSCVSLTKFNFDGEVIKNVIDDTLNSIYFCFEGMTFKEDTLVISTYTKGQKFDSILVIHYDSDLNYIKSNKYGEPLTSTPLVNSGITHEDSSLYVFGNFHSGQFKTDSVHIVKLNNKAEVVDRFYYTCGSVELQINNFQGTPDGNYVFSLDIGRGTGPTDEFSGFQMMKIDPSGVVLDSFRYEYRGIQLNRILSLSSGGFIFGSVEHPFDGWDPYVGESGLINKMDNNMDTLEWSTVLPHNQLIDGRRYRVHDYIEAQNGDILACGTTYENSDTELQPGFGDMNSGWTGFIVRLAPDGEIKWLHVYKENNYLFDHNETGRFRPSFLKNLTELPDGRILAAGNVYWNTQQLSQIDVFETETYHIWLLMVDADGCVEDHTCDEIIRLNTEDQSSITSNMNIWNQVDFIYPAGRRSSRLRFSLDSVELDGNWYFPLMRSLDSLGNRWESMNVHIRQSGQQVYRYYESGEVLLYDFSLEVGDVFTALGQDGTSEVELTVIDTDSIMLEDGSMRKTIIFNCPSGHGFNNFWIEDIGHKSGLLSTYYSCFFDVGSSLLCFSQNGNTLYKDDLNVCWLPEISSANDLASYGIEIYPNPTNGLIKVVGNDRISGYRLYSYSGSIIETGKFRQELNLSGYASGIYFLELQIADKSVFTRIVKE